MVLLYVNRKFVEVGTERHINDYVRMGYIVKILNWEESVEFKAKLRIKAVWDNLPNVLRNRVHFALANQKLTWTERYKVMIKILRTIYARASKITVVHRIQVAHVSIINIIKGIFRSIISQPAIASV